MTNPGIKKYELYASENLVTYLKNDLCNQVTDKVSEKLRNPCRIIIDTARPQIQIVISNNTKQKNFLLFNIYQTKLSMPPITPEYNFGTVGIFERFFTYQAEKNE